MENKFGYVVEIRDRTTKLLSALKIMISHCTLPRESFCVSKLGTSIAMREVFDQFSMCFSNGNIAAFCTGKFTVFVCSLPLGKDDFCCYIG